MDNNAARNEYCGNFQVCSTGFCEKWSLLCNIMQWSRGTHTVTRLYTQSTSGAKTSTQHSVTS